MKIIDVCTYNGEKDIWDLHYNVLKDSVDEFIVVEFDKTFTGKEKPPYGSQIDWTQYPKANYTVHGEALYEKYRELAKKSPNTQGAEHWKLEFMQKESIKDALVHLNDEDLVFIGDVDEIWDPKGEYTIDRPSKLLLKVYTYYLNNRSNEVFRGTLVAQYRDIKHECLNHLRSNTTLTSIGGWHFTSMGGYDELKRKLESSYTRESYWTEEVEKKLAYNMANIKDFLGRQFIYFEDEKEWPQYLKDNREKYAHLCK